ncbi:MAG TPA: hypothetical protein VN048_09775 [Verrucomicrobiae bacterium]|jgi:hypothetical protein|nr:hypothetical protein [Verrucomicrobiae bacterium]
MVSAFSTWKRPVMAALLLLSAPGFTMAQGQSAGGGSLGSTNFRTAGGAEKAVPGEGKLDGIEDQLFGTHKLDVSLPSVPDASPHRKLMATPTPDERMKEKMDAQKNWVFSSMNELNSPQNPEDLAGMPELGPDGREKPRLSAMEKYYNTLGGGQSSVSNRMSDTLTMMWTMKQLSGTNSLSPLMLVFPGGDQTLMQSLMTLPDLNHADGDTTAPDDSASPSDAMAAATAAASADRDEKRRHDAFEEILGTDSTAPASFGGMNNSTPSQPVSAPAYSPVYSPSTAPFTPSSLSPVTTGFTPAAAGTYHPYDGGLAGPATGSGGMNYQNQPALMQPSKPTLPAVLDPFAANFPKRKF